MQQGQRSVAGMSRTLDQRWHGSLALYARRSHGIAGREDQGPANLWTAVQPGLDSRLSTCLPEVNQRNWLGEFVRRQCTARAQPRLRSPVCLVLRRCSQARLMVMAAALRATRARLENLWIVRARHVGYWPRLCENGPSDSSREKWLAHTPRE